MIRFTRNVLARLALYGLVAGVVFVVAKLAASVIPEVVFIVVAVLILVVVCISEEQTNRRRVGHWR